MLLEFLNDRDVIACVHQDRDVVVILGGRANHGWAADINVLDAGSEVAAAGQCRFERIKAHDHDIDRADVMRTHRFEMFGIVAPCQQSPVHRRMQRLDAAIHHFRKTSERADVEHFQSGLAEGLARAAGRNEFDAEAGERARKIHYAGFIGNRDQRA